MHRPDVRHHVIIAGTGRCGTTFLVQLLTRLGLDTGVARDANVTGAYFDEARAGLETDVRRDDAPYVVKNPAFCEHADEVLACCNLCIDHVLIPIRDLQAAAESRRHVTRSTLSKMPWYARFRRLLKPRKVHGGLWHTGSSVLGAQEQVLLQHHYQLLLALSAHQVPVTLLRYPRLVRDRPYCHEKLRPLLGGTTPEEFARAFDATARPELVHAFGELDC